MTVGKTHGKTIQTPYIGEPKTDYALANIYEILNDIYSLIEKKSLETEGFTGIITFVE